MTELEIEVVEARMIRDESAMSSRRRFLEVLGGLAAGATTSAVLAACGSGKEGGSTAPASTGPPEPATDLEIVQYALFLEYLEESFYDQVRDSGEVDGQVKKLVEDVYENEVEHADALETTVEQLGAAPLARPKPNFNAVIEAGQGRILDISAQLENLSASAYLGQAARIQNLQVLDAALIIHTVEARHAAAFNELAGYGYRQRQELTGSIPTGAFAKGRTREEVLELSSPFVKT
jgi:rubrerythrin